MDWEEAGSAGGPIPSGEQGTPKRKKKHRALKALIVVVVIFVAAISCTGINEAQKDDKELAWPSTGLATALPKPSVLKGEVFSNSDTYFKAEVKKCSEKDYQSYVAACADKGFSTDAKTNTSSYEATNEDGLKLRIDYYESMKEMDVTLRAPADKEEPSSSTGSSGGTQVTPAAPDATSDSDSSGSSASSENSSSASSNFKATMDSYEAFMNEYVDFMIKYKDSDNAVSMLADYSSMMSRYADMMETIDAIDEGSLSAADDAYYLQVQSRVLQRLSEVQ